MYYLHWFMILMSLIGLLLIITAFYSYTKLEGTCTSDSLKTKLRCAIGIGSTLLALGIGFSICVNNCKCSFSDLDKNRIYALVGISFISGIGLLVLTFSINTELNDSNCKVDLGIIPWILGLIATTQLLISTIYIVYTVRKSYMLNTKNNVKTVIKTEIEETSNEEKSSQYEAEKEASQQVQKTILNTMIKEKELELDKTKESILKNRSRKVDPKKSDLEKQAKLIKDISSARKELASVGGDGSSQPDLSSLYGSSMFGPSEKQGS